MKTDLAYRKGRLQVEIPEGRKVQVIEPRAVPACPDQRQAQILAMIAEKSEIFVHSKGLTDEQLVRVKLRSCPSIDAALRQLIERLGPGVRVCVLPEGPQTIPYCTENE